MFVGTSRPRLDDKGRLILPARFRDDLAEGLMVTKSVDRCLQVFPQAEFARRAAALAPANVTDERARRLNRWVFGQAHHEVPDRQGRITIPPDLRNYAGLARDLVVLGANAYLEVWDAERYAEMEAEGVPDFVGIAAEGAPPAF